VKRILLATLIVVIAIVLLIVIIGTLLPKNHVSTRAARFQQPPAAIWVVITDYAKFPTWRQDVARVDPLPEVDGKPSWREVDRHRGSIPYEVTVMIPPRAMVTRIADSKLTFGGTWTYEITLAADGASLVRITENGEIYNPVVRFVARFFMAYSKTQEQYLHELGLKFGDSVVIQN
jgi:uncharacterized protein YndB with AHSA1/START domain